MASLTAVSFLVLLAMSIAWGGVARGEEPAAAGGTRTVQKPPTPTAGGLAPSPEFVLYGVIIVDDDQSAFLAEPRLTEGRVRRVVPGTQVGPYRVRGIEADGVLLEGDGPALRVPLGGWASVAAASAEAPLGGSEAARVAALPGSKVGAPAARSGPAPAEATGRPAPNAAAMWRLSEELGLSVGTLEAQAAQTQLEPVELLIAHRLARESKLGLEELVAGFMRRQAWGAIIEHYGVDGEKLMSQVSEFLRATEGSSASRPTSTSQ